MNDTGIEWTDETWNPIRGCSRVSPGCVHCYAEQIAGRFSDEGGAFHGYATRKLHVIDDDHQRLEGRWTGRVELLPRLLSLPLRKKRGRRIFVNSMSDLFHEELTNEQIAAVFGVMAACPQHTFQVLTKRAKRMREWFEWMYSDPLVRLGAALTAYGFDRNVHRLQAYGPNDRGVGNPWPLRNVWIGVSVENQDAANERIPWLTRVPAAVHFLSCEPLLGAIDLRAVDGGVFNPGWLDWVIAGCESGFGARMCRVDWVRSLRDQCAAAGVALFVKQLEACDETTTAPPEFVDPIVTVSGDRLVPVVAGEPHQHKRIAGRRVISLPFLDGRQHAAFPLPRAAA